MIEMNDTENNSADEEPHTEAADAAGTTDPFEAGTDPQPEESAGSESATDGESTPDEAAEEDGEAPEDKRPPTYEELESDIAALKDQLLRTMAEAENVRRRTEREKADASKYAVTNFARAILSVADNLNRALESVSQEVRDTNEDLNNLYIGIEMTENELENVYQQFGIKTIEALGKKFDHNYHQAMFEVEDPEQPAGLVIQQVQKGYMLQDRLLRAAMVGVSKGGPKIEDTPPAENSPADSSGDNLVKTSTAYEKQSDAADHEAGSTGPHVDKEL